MRSFAIFLAASMFCVSLLLNAPVFADTHNNAALRVEFEYPPGWEVETDSQEDGRLSIQPATEWDNMDETGSVVIFRDRGLKIRVPLPEDRSAVEDYFHAVMDVYYTQDGQNYTLITVQDTSLGGYPAQAFVWTAHPQYGDEDSELIKCRDVIMLKGGHVYECDIQAPVSTFNEIWRVGRIVFDSFKVN